MQLEMGTAVHYTGKCTRRYMSMVNYLDTAIGNAVQQLQQKKMWDNTLLVFSADNGGWCENQPLVHIENALEDAGSGSPLMPTSYRCSSLLLSVSALTCALPMPSTH